MSLLWQGVAAFTNEHKLRNFILAAVFDTIKASSQERRLMGTQIMNRNAGHRHTCLVRLKRMLSDSFFRSYLI